MLVGLFILFCVIFLFLSVKTQPALRAYNSVSAKNRKGVVKNSVETFEKIKTAEVILPVIYAHVLHYEPGELSGDSDIARNGGDIYYTPEALQDEEFLKSVMRSPFTVGTHDKNTEEHNRDVDGWPVEAWYDGQQHGVFVRGFVSGADNVAYVEENRDKPKFGTSAYIDFVNLIEESGKSDDGEPYTAKATKLHCNHLAILPNIRDEHNIIVAMNAVNVEEKPVAKQAKPSIKSVITSKIKKTVKGKNNMEKEEIKDVVNEILGEREKAGAMDALNERLDKLEEVIGNGKNEVEIEVEDEDKKESSENKAKNKGAKNEDDDKDDDDSAGNTAASNALPSQELVGTVSNSLGVTFKKTPTLAQLAEMLDVKKGTFLETVSAINAKCKELKEAAGEISSATNSESAKTGDFEKLVREL